MLCLPPLGLVTSAVEGYSFSRPRSFSCILVSSEESHLIATLVKRLWLSYTTGLHIPATRWIWILSCKESPDRCGTCAICRTATAACLFTTSGSVVFLEFSHNQENEKHEQSFIQPSVGCLVQGADRHLHDRIPLYRWWTATKITYKFSASYFSWRRIFLLW